MESRHLNTAVCLVAENFPNANATPHVPFPPDTSPAMAVISGFCQGLGAFQTETISTLVVSFLSLNSAAFILVSFVQLRLKAFDSKLMPKLIACLALGDLGWALTNVVYNSLLLTHGNLGCCAPWACLWARALQQFFALTTVFITVCIACFLMIATSRGHRADHPSLFVVFVVVSLGAALGLDVVLMLLNMEVDGGGWCLPSWPWHMVLWFAPILLCFICCVVLYVLILKKYYGIFGCARRSRGPRASLPIPVRLMFYVLVFLITWVLDLAEFVWVQTGYKCPVWFQLLATTTVNAQGLMNFIVYGILNSELRSNYSVVSGVLTWVFAPLYLIPLSIWAVIQWSRRGKVLKTLNTQNPYDRIATAYTDTDT